MLEIPEAINIAAQLSDSVSGRAIVSATAGQSPHKFTWYTGDPSGYAATLADRPIGDSRAWGGMVETQVGDLSLVFSDGVSLRYLEPDAPRPQKHQLLLELDDGSALVATVQMYGGISLFDRAAADTSYYEVARAKPSPLSDDFNSSYFDRILSSPDVQKLSTKALLATEQRIPGLGNGVLQDILYDSRINPRQKVPSLTSDQRTCLFRSIKSVLREMTENHGRDTERDLYGNPGGYLTRCSKNTVGLPCERCCSLIRKEAYMGGSVYYCLGCQPLPSE